MLEAMSTGCFVIASDTPPVTEVIQDGVNGTLVDFFSPRNIMENIENALDNPDRMETLRINARKTILERYNLEDLLPKHLEWIRDNINT
jgi:glycosyltransferase involved in cell wall biosynthesis